MAKQWEQITTKCLHHLNDLGLLAAINLIDSGALPLTSRWPLRPVLLHYCTDLKAVNVAFTSPPAHRLVPPDIWLFGLVTCEGEGTCICWSNSNLSILISVQHFDWCCQTVGIQCNSTFYTRWNGQPVCSKIQHRRKYWVIELSQNGSFASLTLDRRFWSRYYL